MIVYFTVLWVCSTGFWTSHLDFGLWTLDFGSCMLESISFYAINLFCQLHFGKQLSWRHESTEHEQQGLRITNSHCAKQAFPCISSV